jgi:hypothetical protein
MAAPLEIAVAVLIGQIESPKRRKRHSRIGRLNHDRAWHLSAGAGDRWARAAKVIVYGTGKFGAEASLADATS